MSEQTFTFMVRVTADDLELARAVIGMQCAGAEFEVALAPTPEEVTDELQPVPEDMFRWSVRVMCDAELAEEWLIDIPANTHEDEVEAALGNELAEGNAHFVREQAQNERNREIYDWSRA
jgi:hypothetical protein